MKRILPLLFGLLPLVMNAQASITFHLSGEMGQHVENQQVQLIYVLNEKTVKDSAIIKEGHFVFEGKIPAPIKAYLYFPGLKDPADGPNYCTLYLENKEVRVSIPAYPGGAVITGGKENGYNNQLTLFMHSLAGERRKILSRYRALTPAEKELRPHWKEERDSLLDRNADGQKAILKQFFQSHTASFAGLDALSEFAGPAPDYKTISPLFEKFSPAIRQSVPGVAFGERLQKARALGIGSIAPDFVQKDTAGVPVRLSSLRGNYVLLDFWASWCGPCRAENPNVVKAYEAYKSHGFTVLSVSLDRQGDRQKWLDAIHHDHLEWTHVSDLQYWKNEVAARYGIKAIPQNFLIDPKGKIIASNLRGEALQQTLQKLFN